jgi:hypothetical protein
VTRQKPKDFCLDAQSKVPSAFQSLIRAVFFLSSRYFSTRRFDRPSPTKKRERDEKLTLAATRAGDAAHY